MTIKWKSPSYINPPTTSVHSGSKRRSKRQSQNECIMLIPCRTNTCWFHQFVLPYAETIYLVMNGIKFVGYKEESICCLFCKVYAEVLQRKKATLSSNLLTSTISICYVPIKKLSTNKVFFELFDKTLLSTSLFKNRYSNKYLQKNSKNRLLT